MNIKFNQTAKPIRKLSTVIHGNLFQYQGTYYMRLLDEQHVDKSLVASLPTGKVMFFDNVTDVVVVNAELTIDE